MCIRTSYAIFTPSFSGELYHTDCIRRSIHRVFRRVKRSAIFRIALLARFAFRNLDVTSKRYVYISEEGSNQETDISLYSLSSPEKDRGCCLHAREKSCGFSIGTRCNSIPIKATPIVARNVHCGGIIVRGEDAL